MDQLHRLVAVWATRDAHGLLIRRLHADDTWRECSSQRAIGRSTIPPIGHFKGAASGAASFERALSLLMQAVPRRN